MPRPRGGERLLGPHWLPDRERWRIIYHDGRGGRTLHTLPGGTTEAGAQAALRKLQAELDARAGAPLGPTVGEIAERYCEHLARRGLLPKTVAVVRVALDRLPHDLPAAELRAKHVECYLTDTTHHRHRGKTLTMTSRKAYWEKLCAWAAWGVRQHHLKVDPCAALLRRIEARDDVLPWDTRDGRQEVGRGKAQLRGLDDCRAYIAAALAEPMAGVRVATLLPLLCGLRQAEVKQLAASWVDWSAGCIHVGGRAVDGWRVKSVASRRAVALPAVLHADLRALIAQAPSEDAPLITQRGVQWLGRQIERVCARAGVPRVTSHGLRGTGASAWAELGASVPDIAARLGHADRGTTAQRHYIGSRQVEQRPVLALVPRIGSESDPGAKGPKKRAR